MLNTYAMTELSLALPDTKNHEGSARFIFFVRRSSDCNLEQLL